MKKIKTNTSYNYVGVQTLFVLIMIFSTFNIVLAQDLSPKKDELKVDKRSSSQSLSSEIQTLSKGTEIWSGTAFFRRDKTYSPLIVGPNQERSMDKDIQMNFGADAEYIRLLNSRLGVGLKGFFETVFSENFSSANLAYLGAGPVLRGYFLDKGRFQGYGQTNFLLGYDMDRGRNSPFANRGSEFTYRTELRVGASYRFSNSFGVFLNAGPDWEGGKKYFGYERIQLQVGIQLFRF